MKLNFSSKPLPLDPRHQTLPSLNGALMVQPLSVCSLEEVDFGLSPMVRLYFLDLKWIPSCRLCKELWWTDRWMDFGSQLVATKRIERAGAQACSEIFVFGDFPQDIGGLF